MSNLTVMLLAWAGVVIHVVVGVAAWRRGSALPLIPLVNLVAALCVLGYWAQRWYGYLANGIVWYLNDQLLPIAALLVCVLSAVSLSGKYTGTVPHWTVFAIDALILVAAALFFSFFRINRLF